MENTKRILEIVRSGIIFNVGDMSPVESLTFLWAMETINYGQAIRHHVITNWIIIILGFYGFMNFYIENVDRTRTIRNAG